MGDHGGKSLAGGPQFGFGHLSFFLHPSFFRVVRKGNDRTYNLFIFVNGPRTIICIKRGPVRAPKNFVIEVSGNAFLKGTIDRAFFPWVKRTIGPLVVNQLMRMLADHLAFIGKPKRLQSRLIDVDD
jgi:hypothetical protein